MGYTKNTWITDDIITADRLNAMETGISNFYNPINLDVGYDFDNLKTAGYYMGSGIFPNSPIPTATYAYHVEVYTSRQGFITQKVTRYSGELTFVYVRSFITSWQSWQQLATISSVVSLTGDQTVAGNKSFTGNVSIAGSVMNYTTIPNVSISGYVSGSLKVSKQSGMVSITSMDLVLTKGATVTLPAGYYPRTQLQAPITGQNSTGTTAGGYMTIGVDGSITFNSIGFDSGDATAYVNVHYIAQV